MVLPRCDGSDGKAEDSGLKGSGFNPGNSNVFKNMYFNFKNCSLQDKSDYGNTHPGLEDGTKKVYTYKDLRFELTGLMRTLKTRRTLK